MKSIICAFTLICFSAQAMFNDLTMCPLDQFQAIDETPETMCPLTGNEPALNAYKILGIYFGCASLIQLCLLCLILKNHNK